MKLFKKVAIGTISLLIGYGSCLPTLAEEAETQTYSPKEHGEIIIKYYNDNKQESPVVGSKWRLYKVGSITYSNDGSEVDGAKITSEIKGLELTNETKSSEVLEKIEYTVISESKISVTGKDTNEKDLVFYDAVTDDKGQITFSGLEQGVYLGIEVQAISNHDRAAEFLISVPNTDETGEESNISTVIEPKAVLAGSMTVTKKLEGNNTEASKEWSMELTLPSGSYYYDTNKGKSGYVKNKDIVKIVGGEEITVYDLPTGSKYTVVEKEANQSGYKTTYDNQTDTIEYGKTSKTTVTNTRNKVITSIKTDAGKSLLTYGLIAVVTLGAITYIVISGKNRKKNK